MCQSFKTKCRECQLFINVTYLEGGGTLASKDRAEVAVHAMGQGKLQLRVQQLLDVRATHLSVLHLGNLDDLDGSETGTMSGSQVLVHGSNSLSAAHLAVLLVHVVRTSARIVTDPDAKVLHL